MTMHISTQASHRASRAQRGMTLIELMVAMTLGLILVAGVAAMFVNYSQQRRELNQSAEQIENGRYALGLLATELAHAGYYGYYYQTPTPTSGAALPDVCANTVSGLLNASGAYALSIGVQGIAGAGASPVSCIAASNYQPNTDVLMVRSASTVPTPTASATADNVYLQTSPLQESPILATGADTSSATFRYTMKLNASGTYPTAPLQRYYARIYFISPCYRPASGQTQCTAAADGGKPIPTLRMLELGGDGSGSTPGWQEQILAKGIEQLAFEYGIDDRGNLIGGVASGDGYADYYVRSPANALQWSQVVTVRVTLLARGDAPAAGYNDSNRSYQLASGVTVSGDTSGYRRQLFTEVVRLNNVSGRKEG